MALFFTIAFIGFLWVLFTSALGHTADTVHDIAHDWSHGDTGDNEPSHESGGPITSIFSARVIAIFLMGFGGTGGICRSYDWSYILSSATGIGVGFLVGLVAWGLLEFFAKQQANSVVSASSLVGNIGTVLIPIQGDKAGQVTLVAGGITQQFLAWSNKGKDIGKGRRVRVVSAAGSDLRVEEVAVS